MWRVHFMIESNTHHDIEIRIQAKSGSFELKSAQLSSDVFFFSFDIFQFFRNIYSFCFVCSYFAVSDKTKDENSKINAIALYFLWNDLAKTIQKIVRAHPYDREIHCFKINCCFNFHENSVHFRTNWNVYLCLYTKIISFMILFTAHNTYTLYVESRPRNSCVIAK